MVSLSSFKMGSPSNASHTHTAAVPERRNGHETVTYPGWAD